MNTVCLSFWSTLGSLGTVFWEPFGQFFGHGCESENSAGACMGARFSMFMGGQDRSFLKSLRERRFEGSLLMVSGPI